jgi:hypothetical protein
VRGGVAAPRASRSPAAGPPVQVTSGGLIFNGFDISALVAAVGSGLPGVFALRLDGEGPFEIPALDVHPYQEVRIICTNVGALVLLASEARATLNQAVVVGGDGALVITGEVGSLDIQGGVTVAEGATMTVTGTVGLMPLALFSMLIKQGDGA